MNKAHVMHAKFAARIRSIAVQNGPLSLAGRIRPEAIEIAAKLYAPTASSSLQDNEVIAALSRLHSQHPEYFLTHEEAQALMQEKRGGLVSSPSNPTC